MAQLRQSYRITGLLVSFFLDGLATLAKLPKGLRAHEHFAQVTRMTQDEVVFVAPTVHAEKYNARIDEIKACIRQGGPQCKREPS